MTYFVLIGLLLGLLALAFVLYPIVRPASAASEGSRATSDLQARRHALYRQILDVEFDQQLGKIDEADARELSARLLRAAASLLEQQTGSRRDADEELEREIAAVRRALAAARQPELESAAR